MSVSSREPETIADMTTDQQPRQHPVTEGLLHGTKPRAVTVETAHRCELWRYGTLLHEVEKAWDIKRINEGWEAEAKWRDETKKIQLMRGGTLLFIPNK